MYKNYGGPDFFENGLLINGTADDTVFDVVSCSPVDKYLPLYQFAHFQVDIMAPWLGGNALAAVERHCGVGREEDPVRFVIGFIDYYGVDNPRIMNRGHVLEALLNLGIAPPD